MNLSLPALHTLNPNHRLPLTQYGMHELRAAHECSNNFYTIIVRACSQLQNRLRQDFIRELAKACETELKIDPAVGPTTENPFWVDVSIIFLMHHS